MSESYDPYASVASVRNVNLSFSSIQGWDGKNGELLTYQDK